MREAFRIIARWLQDSGIKPRDVEVIIRFKDKRDRDKASFAAGKEFESGKRLPGIPEHIYAGDFYGVTFELRSHADA